MNAKSGVIRLFKELTKEEDVNINSRLYDYMDSLDSVEYIIKAEQFFNVSIRDDEAEKINTPNDLLKIVYKYRPDLQITAKIKRILNKN